MKNSRFSILVQYFNLSALIAYRKFTKSIPLEERSSCDLPILAALLRDQQPCMLFCQEPGEGAVKFGYFLHPESNHTLQNAFPYFFPHHPKPFSIRRFLSPDLEWICHSHQPKIWAAALMKSTLHFIIIKLLNWSDQESRSQVTQIVWTKDAPQFAFNCGCAKRALEAPGH